MGTKKKNYYESLNEDMKTRYDVKIAHCGGIDPYSLSEKELSVDRSDFPEITLIDIGNYMIYAVSSFTKRSLKAYKSMDGYKFFESGYVLSLGARKMENLSILKGKVRHSQKMNDPPHQVWVLAKMDGKIICGHCTCIAGLSETCSHVGAICFAVMNIAESNETTSVTDVLCKWNVPKFKEVSMSAVRDIKWNSAELIEPDITPHDNEPTFRAHCNSLSAFTDEDVTRFIDLIHSDGQETALRTLLYPNEIRRATSLNDEIFLASIYNLNNKSKTLVELIQIGREKQLQISEEESKKIAELTTRKNKSKYWIPLRRGRITGCSFKNCCIASIENPSVTTINRIMNPMKNMDLIPSIKYQRKNKKKALTMYLTQVDDEEHENFKYEESGLIINGTYPYFAASTDGIVSCSCHGKGCVEIKCFEALKASDSFDALTRKPKNVLNKVGAHFAIERDHELYYKIQMQIHMCEVEFCDVVIWSPGNTLILPVYADIEFWNQTKDKAVQFHQEVMMPELLGKFFTGHRKEQHQCAKKTAQVGTGEEGNGNSQLVGLDVELLDLELNVDDESTKESGQIICLEIELLDSEDE